MSPIHRSRLSRRLIQWIGVGAAVASLGIGIATGADASSSRAAAASANHIVTAAMIGVRPALPPNPGPYPPGPGGCYPRAACIPPPAPTNLSITGHTQTSIALQWTDNATNDGDYTVSRSQNGGAWTDVADLGRHAGTGPMSYTDAGLAPGTSYCYRVTAWNLYGEAAATSGAACGQTDQAPPAAPGAPSIVAGTSTSLSVQWTDNATNEDGYQVQRSPDGAAWATVATLDAHAGTGAMGYTDAGLSPSTRYCYRVRTWNVSGDAYSATTCGTTLPAPPAAPGAPSFTAKTLTTISLQWSDNAVNEDGYQVQRSPDGSVWTTIATLGAQAGTGPMAYKDSGMQPGASYCYRVRTWNAGGEAYSPATCGQSGSWTYQNSGTSQDLKSVSCPSTSNCVAVGAYGWILTTNNGGSAWNRQYSGTTQDLKGVACPSVTACYAVGGNGTILFSPNGGGSWYAQNSHQGAGSVTGVSCPTTTTCYAVGNFSSGGTILATTDGGANWVRQYSSLYFPLYGIACPSQSVCYAVGEYGTIVATTNGGASWSQQSSRASAFFTGIACPAASTCYAAGDTTVDVTTDGGATWTPRSSGTSNNLTGIACSSATVCYASVGGNSYHYMGSVIATIDGGATWATSFGTAYGMNGVSCAGSGVCAAVGDTGTIETTTYAD